MAKAADFDYERLLAERRPQVRALVKQGQQQFAAANPAYEQMEGVVAGVPSLADFDVSIDAGGDASDPENAVPFSIKTPDGRTFKQPGNLNYLIETSLFGTEPKFTAKGCKPDLDGDGRVEFGEALPDATFYVAAAREFERTAGDLDAAARRVAADAAGRTHGAGRDDAHHVRVLRGVEEQPVRGRRAGDREGVRGRVAAAGHHRHPLRPRPDLRQRAAADRHGRRASRPARPPAACGALHDFAAPAA